MAERRMAQNPEVAYEPSDADLHGIGHLWLTALAAVVLIPLGLGLAYPSAFGDVFKQLRVAMPAPRLQRDETAPLGPYRAAQEARLASYGWVDRDSGIVHIPIAQAMERLAREGIAGWPEVKR